MKKALMIIVVSMIGITAAHAQQQGIPMTAQQIAELQQIKNMTYEQKLQMYEQLKQQGAKAPQQQQPQQSQQPAVPDSIMQQFLARELYEHVDREYRQNPEKVLKGYSKVIVDKKNHEFAEYMYTLTVPVGLNRTQDADYQLKHGDIVWLYKGKPFFLSSRAVQTPAGVQKVPVWALLSLQDQTVKQYNAGIIRQEAQYGGNMQMAASGQLQQDKPGFGEKLLMVSAGLVQLAPTAMNMVYMFKGLRGANNGVSQNAQGPADPYLTPYGIDIRPQSVLRVQ